MVFKNNICEVIYQKCSKLDELYREHNRYYYPDNLVFCDKDIELFPEVEKELALVNNIFTGTLRQYRKFFQMVRLAAFINQDCIRYSSEQLKIDANINIPQRLHHNPELTSLIVSQLPSLDSIRFYGKGPIKRPDIQSGNIMIEVGDTRVSKVEQCLGDNRLAEVCVFPLVCGLPTIKHKFIRGKNWQIVDEWLLRLNNDTSQYALREHRILSSKNISTVLFDKVT
jgi:hypothetical protein